MRRLLSIAAATAMATAAALAVPPATSTTAEASDPLVTGLAGPLQFDVAPNDRIYVAQSFAGVVTKVRRDGTTKDLVTEIGGVGGVAADGYDVAYTFTGGDEAQPVALLKRRFANGTISTVANLYRYERRNNPDAGSSYGFRNLSAACAAKVPAEIGGEPYGGIVESNPYAVANAPDGGWYVADAAANAVLHVRPGGRITTFGVLRPRKTVITQEAAAVAGLPRCTVGETYAFEAVPTDVEVKPTGALIVSLLPGGPEDASFGARGAIIRLAGDGEFANLAQGFLGATNVALAPGGRIYVAELFGNRISLLQNRVVTPVANVPSPAGLEYSNGTLYASVDVFGTGSVVTIQP